MSRTRIDCLISLLAVLLAAALPGSVPAYYDSKACLRYSLPLGVNR